MIRVRLTQRAVTSAPIWKACRRELVCHLSTSCSSRFVRWVANKTPTASSMSCGVCIKKVGEQFHLLAGEVDGRLLKMSIFVRDNLLQREHCPRPHIINVLIRNDRQQLPVRHGAEDVHGRGSPFFRDE